MDYLSGRCGRFRCAITFSRGFAPKPIDFIESADSRERITDRASGRGSTRSRCGPDMARCGAPGSDSRYRGRRALLSASDNSRISSLFPLGTADRLPLELFEDPQLNVGGNDRETWLGQWHDERAWLTAVHRTRYSNGIISLTEELLDPPGLRNPATFRTASASAKRNCGARRPCS